MSFILDALRRADAERHRGAVPGLHAQPTPVALADGHAAAQAGRLGPGWLGGGAAVLALVVGGGLVWVLKPAPPPLPVVPSVPAPVVLQAAVPVPVPTTVAPAGAAASVGVAAPPEAPRVVVKRPPVAPLVVQPAIPAVIEPSTAPIPILAGTPVHPAAPGAVPQRLPTVADLPDAVRRELPALRLGGSVYAEQPPQRLVIINGLVFHEGEQPAPGLLVRQIRLKSVVFSFRDQVFELAL